jgi:flagellar hook assembly protein FlgD
LLVGLVSTSFAGTYASGLRVSNPDTVKPFDGNFTDASGALLWFTLNGHADTVKVWVLSNNVRIKAFAPLLNRTPGHHNVLWDGKNDDTVFVGVGNYSFEVWTSDTGNSTATWAQAWENPVYLGTGIGLSSRDVDVVNDPMHPWFGNYIMSEPSSYGYARILVANADGSMKVSFGDKYYPLPPTGVDPWYVSVAKNGNLYVTSQILNKVHVYKDTILIGEIDAAAPRGIATLGAGDPTLFIATGSVAIRRVPNGTVDTVYNTGTGYVRDIAVDDSGYIYISTGAGTAYNTVVRLSPSRVVLDTITLPGNVTHLTVSRGANLASNADDILYGRVPGAANGVFKIDFGTKTATQAFAPAGVTSTSANHSIAVDAFGNIVYSNPSNEWNRLYIPPGAPVMKFTTKGGPMNVLPAATNVLDAFDTGMGRFGSHPTFSGSTAGIAASPTSNSAWTQAQKMGGSGGAMVINLIDDPVSTAAWSVRFLSGVGQTVNNVNIGPKGWVGYWMKTSTAHNNAKVGIVLDDLGDGPAHRRSVLVPVINDGEWHLYQWNMEDSTQWTIFAGAPAGVAVKGPAVSIDALWFSAPDSSAPWTIHLDNVSHNPAGRIGREPGRGDVTNNALVSALDASWILQHVVKLRPFSPEQVMAADVNLSHNGTAVNAFDAGMVLGHVVGKVAYLPWTMPPPPLTNINGEDPAPLSVIVASVSGTAGKVVNIPISVPNDLAGLQSAEMEVQFDAAMLKVRSVSTTNLTNDFMVASNIQDGKVSIAMANGEAILHGGQILMIEAEILQSSENITITVDKIQLNDKSIMKTTSVGNGQAEIPQTFALMQNYPNPFNPSTTIEYQLPVNGFVELKVYDIAGREVATLVSEMKNAGTHRIAWNAVDDRGTKVSSGVYFYRISAGQFNQIKKMVLLK